MNEENEILQASAFVEPFPHIIISDFYNSVELKLIWEELNYYTKPGKLLEAKDFGGVVDKTNSHALVLDNIYNNRNISNILQVNRKLFNCGVISEFAKLHPCCSFANLCNTDITKVRYYHDGDYYDSHGDYSMHFLSFSYFYKEPKQFDGGELFFPDHDYFFDCKNNSMIIFPGWVQHGVKEVSVEDRDYSNYYDGWGRYSITNFFSYKKKEDL